MRTNVAIISNPVAGTVEVQVPVTVSNAVVIVTILYHKHSAWETVSMDSETGPVDFPTAKTRARTRLRGMLATSTDDHTITILRRCCDALHDDGHEQQH